MSVFNTCIFSVSQRAGCLFCHAFGLYPDEPVNFFSANPELVCQICQKCQTTRGAEKSVKSINLLSLGRVFQFHVLCRLQASFRDMGQNSALRRPVDSATCGPELKQSLGLKSACKEPLSGLKGAPKPATPQACDSQTSTRRLLWQLAALPSSSQASE